MKIYKAFILFVFPTYIARIILIFSSNIYIEKKVKIGFSFIIADNINLKQNSLIGHFNFIKVNNLIMENKSQISRFNLIKGPIFLMMKKASNIKQFNKITRAGFPITNGISKFLIGENSILGMNTFFDLTDSIFIDKNCVFAGIGTQLWTHGYYHFENGKRVRIEGEICIGENNYIGSRCTIMPGVSTANNISVGANSVISKSLEKDGAYVNQGLRFLGKILEYKLINYEKIGRASCREKM